MWHQLSEATIVSGLANQSSVIYVYYIDKIESLNFLINVCRKGSSKDDKQYTSRFSVSRRRFGTHQNTDLVITVIFCIQCCFRLNTTICRTLAEYLQLGEKFHLHFYYFLISKLIRIDSMLSQLCYSALWRIDSCCDFF